MELQSRALSQPIGARKWIRYPAGSYRHVIRRIGANCISAAAVLTASTPSVLVDDPSGVVETVCVTRLWLQRGISQKHPLCWPPRPMVTLAIPPPGRSTMALLSPGPASVQSGIMMRKRNSCSRIPLMRGMRLGTLFQRFQSGYDQLPPAVDRCTDACGVTRSSCPQRTRRLLWPAMGKSAVISRLST